MRRGKIAVIVALAAVVGATAAPAPAAATAALELSRDGTRFARTFPGSIFPSGYTLVPGDTVDARFWVRNGGDTPAWVSLGLEQGVTGATAYLRALTLTVDVDGARHTHALDGRGCVDVADATPILPGQRVQVGLALGFGGVTGTQAQREVADLTFLVSMTDAAAVQTGLGACALALMPRSAGETVDAAAAATPAWSERLDGEVELGAPGAETPPNTAVDAAGWALVVLLGAAMAGAALRMGSARRDVGATEEDT